MSYPREMANWGRVMRKISTQAANRAATEAVREVYQLPEFLRREATEKREQERQGDLFGK